MKHIKLQMIPIYLFRFALSVIFIYFGVLAIQDPTLQATLWIRSKIQIIITYFMPLSFFMYALGVLEILIGFFILCGVFLTWALLAASLLLIGIIINLGFNEISLRDFVIFTSILYFLVTYKKVISNA